MSADWTSFRTRTAANLLAFKVTRDLSRVTLSNASQAPSIRARILS